MYPSAAKSADTIYWVPTIILVAALSAIMVLCAPSKSVAALSLVPVMGLVYVAGPRFSKIVFPMIMITFPITLQYSGKDAFSTGTVAILLTLAWALATYRVSDTVANDKFPFVVLLLLLCIALVGMATGTPSQYWGPAVRCYLSFISSIAVFILIIHCQRIPGIAVNTKDYIDKIITAVLFITLIHVFFSALILQVPWVQDYFSVFFKRTQEHIGGEIVEGVYTRAATLFTGGEEFGELFILLFPFSLYKVFISKNKFYILVIASFSYGTIISGTRSAFLMIVFQFVFFVYLTVPPKYNSKKILFSIFFVLMLPIVLKYIPVLTVRIRDMIELVAERRDIVTILNRQAVWPMAYEVTAATISLFGHGPIQAGRLGFSVGNFHSFYLSAIFQFGIIGTLVFFFFFHVLAKRLLKGLNSLRYKGPDYLLGVACLLSLGCFLINEIKFEFNRGDSYQQFVWIIFAVFYLTSQLLQHSAHEKTDFNQPNTIRTSN